MIYIGYDRWVDDGHSASVYEWVMIRSWYVIRL